MAPNFCQGTEVILGHGRRVITPQGLNFEFPSGKATALIGPNGSGKTTLLRALTGDPCLKSGDIWLGKDRASLRTLGLRGLSKLAAVVPQEHRYPKHLLLEEALRLAFLPEAGLLGKLPLADSEPIVEACKQFRLSSLTKRTLGELSTGERQRAFLARAFLQHSQVLLLDEPTNHLDPGGRAQFWNALVTIRKKSSVDVIISTHDLEFVKQHCEWVCALKSGQIVYSGPSTAYWESHSASSLFEDKSP